MTANRPFGRPSGRPFRTGGTHGESSFDDDDEPFESDPREAQAARSREREHAARQAPAASTEPGALSYSRHTRRTRGSGAGRAVTRNEPSANAEEGGAVESTTERAPRRSERQVARDAALGFKRSLRGRALGYLSRREHSRSELARKLAPFVEESDDADAIERVLDALGKEGWLSDHRFAESVVNRRAARFGTARIVGELKQHKLDGALVQELGASLRETEWGRIQEVWRRKFGRLAVTPQERAKQARFLAARGFSRDLIMRVMKVGDEAFPDDE